MHLGISNTHFHLYTSEWKWIEKYIARFRKTPSKGAFKSKFPDFGIKAVDDVEHFSHEVKTQHAKFVLSEILDVAIGLVETDDIEQAAATLMSGAIKVQGTLDGDSGDFSLFKDYDLVYQEVKRRCETTDTSGMSGVPSGFPTLDNITGGGQEGELHIIGARLGVGKTFTLNTMSMAAMCAGYDVQYNALEQTKAQIAFRMHSFLSARYGKQVFNSADLIRGKGFSLKDYKSFLEETAKLGIGNLFVADSSRGKINPVTMAAQIERTKPAMVVLDYIQIAGDREKDWQSLAKLSGDLKMLATRYGIYLVCAAQINRTGAGKMPPGVDTLGGSDGIGQDADVVVTIAKQTQSVVRMRLAKNRNNTDEEMWYCEFAPGRGIYEEISGDRASTLMDSDNEED